MQIDLKTKQQQAQADAEVRAAMQKMQQDVKRKLKTESKNELIRIIGALLMDNYALKLQLAELQQSNQAVTELNKPSTAEQGAQSETPA